MRNVDSINIGWFERRMLAYRGRSFISILASNLLAASLAVVMFYFSLVATSAPVSKNDMAVIDHSIAILEAKGFDREAFLLRHTTTFRSTDHWLNRLIFKESAYAATNFPLQIVTVYPDFYTKAEDDTERAMILLHEAQHLQNADEKGAYSYVWQNRWRLGWTQLPYGTTETYITIELQTRENAPELFNCSGNLWNDCTLKAGA